MFSLILYSAVLGYLIYFVLTFYHNFAIAKKIGYPILFSPFSDGRIVYLISKYMSWEWVEWFPQRIADRFLWHGLAVRHNTKYRVHEAYGSTFVSVGPDVGWTWVHTANPDLAMQVVCSKAFLKDAEFYGELVRERRKSDGGESSGRGLWLTGE